MCIAKYETKNLIFEFIF